MVLREQTWQLQIPEPQALALPEGESSAFPSSNNPFHCAGVWDQKESAEDSLGLGSKSGHLELLSMEKPQWRGPCLWLQLGWCQESTGPWRPSCGQSAHCVFLASGSEGGMGHPCLGMSWSLSEAQMLPPWP